MNSSLVESLQAALRQEKVDGWFFYSFRDSDPIAESILRLDQIRLATRRWFYFVPAAGAPQKIVHAIEPEMLEIPQYLRDAMRGSTRVAMQYSPLNAIPYISRVVARAVELIRNFGVEVVSVSGRAVSAGRRSASANSCHSHCSF